MVINKHLSHHLWGIWENDEHRLCKRIFPWQESAGHIQAKCPVLTKPRIAVHNGIWRELLTAIIRNSTETHDGVTSNAKDKECVFLEFTRPMDSVTSSDEGDWAERKRN